MKSDKTLDLTMFDFTRLGIQIRERTIADWAHDMWVVGNRLTRIRFTRPMYESFKRELEKNNTYISINNLNELLTIDVGFGPIELVVED